MSRKPLLMNIEYMMRTVKAGDIIAFSGNSPISKLIKYITRSHISHVGIVVETPFAPFVESYKQIVEATSSGVSMSPLKTRILKTIRDTEVEPIWLLPLEKKLKYSESKSLNKFLAKQLGKQFDYVQSIQTAFDNYDPNPFTYAVENLNEFFCAELVAAALEESKVITNINASEVTPADLSMFNIFKYNYYQLKGEPTSINGYNSIPPFGWGQ